MKSPLLILLCFLFSYPLLAQQSKPFPFQGKDKAGLVEVQTATRSSNERPQIALIKRNEAGEAIWFNVYGGSSYERAADVLYIKDEGYLILGATSSYGNGNYDLYVIKTDPLGNQIWSKTFGDFYNEYGQTVELAPNGNFRILATKQVCTGEKNNFSKCAYFDWKLEIDQAGNLIQEKVINASKVE